MAWQRDTQEVQNRLNRTHPDKWIIRTRQGLRVLGDVGVFKPTRMVIEAFNGAVRHDRLQAHPPTDGTSRIAGSDPRRIGSEASQTFTAYGTLLSKVSPTHLCCWNEQMSEYGLHAIFMPMAYRPKFTHHVLLDDDHELFVSSSIRKLNIRFTPLWVNTLPTSRAQRSVGTEVRDLDNYVRELEETCDDRARHRKWAKDLARGAPASADCEDPGDLTISIAPCFPGTSMPINGVHEGRVGKDIEDEEEDGINACYASRSAHGSSAAAWGELRGADEWTRDRTNGPGPASLPCRSVSSSPSSISADADHYNYDYDRYMQAWQDWCDKMNRIGYGKAVRVSLRLPSRCDACGEDQLNPEDPACSGYIDKSFVDQIFKVLGVPERQRDVGGAPMPWRTKVNK